MACALVCAAPAHASERTGRILVSLDEGVRATAEAAAALGARHGLRDAGPEIPQVGVVTVRPEPWVPLDVALERLRRDPVVRAAAAEGRFRLREMPSDAALTAEESDPAAPHGASLQWALHRQGFPAAWTHARGDGAVVAVIDTGVDATHPDLQGKLAGALDFDGVTSDPATYDADGHGTHVGSLACAATDNGIGIAGAGYDCRLLAIKTDLSDASVVQGIVAAADRGAHALNMSFGDDGGDPSPALRDAVEYAVARGVVLVAAAADEPIEEQGEPANLLQPTGTGPDAGLGRGLSVTAATADDARASFAGRGSQISLASYGALSADAAIRGIFGLYPANETPRERAGVLSTSAGCRCRAPLDGDDRYAFLPGTSMAAPQVAAAAALLRALNPDLTALEVVRLLKDSARRPRGAWSQDLGWGIIDIAAAVQVARMVDRRPPSSRARLGAPRSRAAVVRWSGRDRAPAGMVASRIAAFELWRSVDGGAARRLATPESRRRRVHIVPGRRYAFWTVAVDAAGNREAAPAAPDAVVAGR